MVKVSKTGNVLLNEISVCDSVDISSSSGLILAENLNICHREIRNLSDTAEVSLGFGTDAVINKGVLLKPGEGWWPLENIFCGVINGISNSGTATLTVLEY